MSETAVAPEPSPSPAPPEMPPVLDNRTRWAVMGAILLTVFLSSLDQTVVGTALPRIVTDLSGASLYSWVVTSYLLASTITVPVYGKFSDVFGRKPLLLIGVGLFLGGSWLSGLSQNMSELVAFRAVQGLGAGAIFPLVMAIIGDTFTPRERGRYQGLFGAVFGLSFIVGPFIGGWITDNISWHWVFYVNVPVGVAALAVLIAVLPAPPSRQASIRDLDYLGIALFTAGVVPVMLGLTNKGELNSSGQLYAWTDPNVGGLMLLGLAVLVVFAFVESRAKEPIIPLDLFRARDYSVSMAAVFLFGVAMFTAVIFMPRFYQTVRGISATASGYYIWPILVGLMGGSIGSGQLISRFGRYKWLMVGGAVLLLAGAFLLTHLTTGTPDWNLWLWMLLLGLGIGPGMAGFTVVGQNLVPLSRLPDALAAQGVPPDLVAQLVKLNNVLQGVGGAQTVVGHLLPAQLQPLVPKIGTGVHDAFSGALADIFWVTIVAGAGALVCTLLLRDRPLRSAPDLRQELVTAKEPPAAA